MSCLKSGVFGVRACSVCSVSTWRGKRFRELCGNRCAKKIQREIATDGGRRRRTGRRRSEKSGKNNSETIIIITTTTKRKYNIFARITVGRRNRQQNPFVYFVLPFLEIIQWPEKIIIIRSHIYSRGLIFESRTTSLLFFLIDVYCINCKRYSLEVDIHYRLSYK